MTGRADNLLSKIYSEGYCCLRGYLGLCKSRGETVKGMAEFISISPHTIWYHFRRMNGRKITCQKRADCLEPIIKEIEQNKSP